MPFLFFGSRTVRKRLGEGTFDCPRCGVRRPYTLMRAQPHAHLYWLPLLKLGPPSAYVECGHCRAAFAPGVLEGARQDPEDLRGAVETAVTAALASVLRSTTPSQREAALVAEAVTAIRGYPVDAASAAAVLTTEPRDAERAARGLAHVEPTLTNDAREGIMSALLHVATADGAMTSEQAASVQTLAAALRVSSAHLKGLMLELAERRGADGGRADPRGDQGRVRG